MLCWIKPVHVDEIRYWGFNYYVIILNHSLSGMYSTRIFCWQSDNPVCLTTPCHNVVVGHNWGLQRGGKIKSPLASQRCPWCSLVNGQQNGGVMILSSVLWVSGEGVDINTRVVSRTEQDSPTTVPLGQGFHIDSDLVPANDSLG